MTTELTKFEASRDVTKIKAKLLDIVLSDAVDYEIVQLKFDGFWTMLEFTGTECIVWTSAGCSRGKFPIVSKPMTLLAEWNFGTNWSCKHPELAEFNVHDVLAYNGLDFTEHSGYSYRYQVAQKAVAELSDPRFQIVQWWTIDQTQMLWNEKVVEQGYEGLVFKNWNSGFGKQATFARCKRNVSKEYIFMGCAIGAGKYASTCGSVICGLYVNGILTKILNASGMTDSQRNEFWGHRDDPDWVGKRVLEVEGKVYFEETGSLRHPVFHGWRHEILPMQCTLAAGCHSEILS